MEWRRKTGGESLNVQEKKGVVWLEFPALSQTGQVRHGFSTRLGGVSQGDFSSMNFTFTRGDHPEHVGRARRHGGDDRGVLVHV